MSGPKTSRYTLTAEQRRILAEQRKIERRKAAAREKIKRAQSRLLAIGGRFGAEKQIAAELTSRTGSDNGMIALLDDLDRLIASTQPLIVGTDFDDVDSVEKTASDMKVRLAETEKIADRIAVLSVQNEASLRSDLQKVIDHGFEHSFAEIRMDDAETDSLSVLQGHAMQKLAQLKQYTILPQEYQDKTAEASEKVCGITDKTFLRNYIAVTVNQLVKETEQFVAEYELCREEFEELYAEYTALCELYYYVAQEYVCSRESIQILKDEIKRIKDAVAADDEQAYISECLDEVMEEMGYFVLGSREVTKRSGKRFRNELYSYGEGTAVNVTYSSDGRIAMEIGGVDTDDRIPTAQETTLLCNSMEQFCRDFETIEKRLREKGVVLAERVSLLPPDAEYAQIINTAEYSLETEVKTIAVKKQRRAAVKQKTMRRE